MNKLPLFENDANESLSINNNFNQKNFAKRVFSHTFAVSLVIRPMKRYLFLFVALVIGVLTSAQTQQGYVKTKGRMVNGKLVPGQGLKGATR